MTGAERPVESHELRDVVDEMQIRRLHARYVDAVNRSAWEELYHDRYARLAGHWRFAQRRYDRLYATAPAELEVQPVPPAFDVDDPVAPFGMES